MDVLNKHRKTERIGRLNKRVQLHYATESVNAYGERVEAWASAGTFWASIEYARRSKEQEQAGQETAQQSTEITIRYNDNLSENWRLYHDGRLYDIESVAISNDNAYMVLGCQQIQAATLNNPETGYPVGALAFTQTFTGITGTTVTVTVYGGLVPDDKARVFVFVNGVFNNNFNISGANIVFTSTTLIVTDKVVVTFFI